MSLLASVVIPSHNQPDEFLGACLASLQQQTMSAWEAVVVDDGSTRGNVEAFVAAVGDPRVRSIRHENRGIGGARNTGFRAAQAEFVLSLDADDRLDPAFLELAVSTLEMDAVADCVFMDSQCFGSSRDMLRFPVPLPPPCPQHPTFPDSGVLMRKRLWEKVGGYSEDRSIAGVEWWDFWLRATDQGMQPRHIAKPFYLYRRHRDSASLTSSMDDEHRNRELLYRRHRGIFDAFRGNCGRTPHSIGAFLAEGYVMSSRAALAKQERWRAARLALRGFLRYPHSSTAKQIARVLVSGSPAEQALRRLAHRSR